MSQIWSTAYGQTLVVKTVLLVVCWRWHRAAAGCSIGSAALRQSVLAELVVLAAVVAAVALLTNLPPGNRPSAACAATQPAAAGGPAAIAARGGARVSVWPGRGGDNAIGLVLPRSAGDPKLLLQRQDGSRQPASLGRSGRARGSPGHRGCLPAS